MTTATAMRVPYESVDGKRQEACPGSAGYLSSFGFGVEVPEMLFPAVEPDLSTPLLQRFMPGDATISGRGTDLLTLVLRLRPSRDNPQVAPTVVQLVPIDVIDFKTITSGQTDQLAVQLEVSDIPTVAAAYVLAPRCITVPVQTPPPLSDPTSIGGINDGVRSDAAISVAQRDAGCTVGHNGDDAGRLDGICASLASLRAKTTPASGDLGRPRPEVLQARLAGANGVTIPTHRTLQRSGAMPPAVSSSAGVSCVNFTAESKETA